MKSILFRQKHFLQILNLFDPNKGPLDLFISRYLRAHPQLGSKDRLFVVERLYNFFRWKALLEGKEEEELFDLLEQDLSTYGDTSLEEHVRVSFPKWLFEALQRRWKEKTVSICLSSNKEAPITLRTNSMKISRKELLERLRSSGIEAREHPQGKDAIILSKRMNVWILPEFKEGLFEMQDAGSQKVAELIEIEPGDSFLDYCAGSGGKALACAPKMKNRGQIFLHDIRPKALQEAKQRLKRAGIQNAQCILNNEKKRLKLLKERMDFVLVDVPCSGTGTLRRNPDMKWRLSPEKLASLIEEQREIFDQAFSFVRPGGKIVYVTCSLLAEENEEQIELFISKYSLEIVGEPFQTVPEDGRMDGFFAVCMQKREDK